MFSFISSMRCYVLNLLLSSPSGTVTVFTKSCLVRYMSTVPSGEDNNRILENHVGDEFTSRGIDLNTCCILDMSMLSLPTLG
jgi:hypothetical protein